MYFKSAILIIALLIHCIESASIDNISENSGQYQQGHVYYLFVFHILFLTSNKHLGLMNHFHLQMKR